MKRTYIIAFLVLMVALSGCGYQEHADPSAAQEYVSTRHDLPQEIKVAILAGKTVVGMYPDESVAASGPFHYMIEAGKIKVGSANINNYFAYLEARSREVRIPPDILWKQRRAPDSSRIALGFRNRTQFDSDEEVLFTVIFDQGRVVGIIRSDDSIPGEPGLHIEQLPTAED